MSSFPNVLPGCTCDQAAVAIAKISSSVNSQQQYLGRGGVVKNVPLLPEGCLSARKFRCYARVGELTRECKDGSLFEARLSRRASSDATRSRRPVPECLYCIAYYVAGASGHRGRRLKEKVKRTDERLTSAHVIG